MTVFYLKKSKQVVKCLTFVVKYATIFLEKQKGIVMKLEHSMPIRIDKRDYDELRRIKDKTGVPIIRLIEFAIPLLKKKYRIREE